MENNKPKHEKKDTLSKKKKIALIVLEIFFLATAIFSLIKIIIWFYDNKQSKEILEEISSQITVEKIAEEGSTEVKEVYKVDFNSLKQKNPDTVAFIKIENTNIEYPVVKGRDNSFYLSHSFDKKNNSAGWIFMDYKNKADGTDRNTVIYGHNRKDTSMFGTLRYVLDDEWYKNEDNRFITYISENENCKFEIFSVYRIEDEDYYIKTNFASDKEYLTFLNRIKSRSEKNFNIEITENDQILTLSTCSNTGYRLAVHAKKIID